MVKRYDIDEAKKIVAEQIALGKSVRDATLKAGRTAKTYEQWRAEDPNFRSKIDLARQTLEDQRNGNQDPAVMNLRRKMGFADFRRVYLGRETYPHQQQWIDVLEGREPTPIEGCEYKPANPRRILINTPPGHAKSSTITVDFATYKICMNPNIRIVIMSKTKDQAKKFLHQIKNRLTSDMFAKLQADFAPPGGFRPERGQGQFSQNQIYLAGSTADEKDPAVQALGLGGQIYGTRADLVILDDVVNSDNAQRYEDQIDFIQTEVENRLKGGTIVIVGTRLKSVDLYSELLRPDRYMSGKTPWTYLRQPMVTRFADQPEDWQTLWPKSSTPYDEADDTPGPDGMFIMYDGPRALEARNRSSAQVWSMVYQQMTMSDDATFKPTAVFGSMDRRRKPGPLTAGAWGHPKKGGDGMWTIASMDPAMAGDTFVLVGKVDRVDRKRWIEQAWVQTAPSVEWIRNIVKSVTETYGVNEWVIESNAFQIYLTQDPEIIGYLQNKGVRMTPHHTSTNKIDPDFGVASLEPLFGTIHRINEEAGREVHDGNNLIQLPDVEQSAGLKALIEQLFSWMPGIRGRDLKQDGPMALWFFETRARIIIGTLDPNGGQQNFVRTKFQTRAATQRQGTRPSGFFGRRSA